MADSERQLPSERSSIKVMTDDYECLRSSAERFGATITDAFTGWRQLWESASEKQRQDAMKRAMVEKLKLAS